MKYSILRFTAEWCAPCKMLAPVLEQYATDNPDIKVEVVDADENPEAAQDWGVQGIPTVILLRDGLEVDRFIGARPYRFISNFVDAQRTAILSE